MFTIKEKIVQFAGKELKLQTGKIARQANSVTVQMGNTVVLCTVVVDKQAKPGVDFFPLTVHYLERYYATGRFPGSFTRREGKPTDREVLTSRLIDRPIRPMFPHGFFNEIQIVCTTLAYDPAVQPDILALIGASAAMALSGAPYLEVVAAARVGYVNGEYVLNPSAEELLASQLDLVVAGTQDSVLMVESEAKELSEEVMLGAVNFGHDAFQPVIDAIKEMAAAVVPMEYTIVDSAKLLDKVKEIALVALQKAYQEKGKAARRQAIADAFALVEERLVVEEELDALTVKLAFKQAEAELLRSQILNDAKRIDGRKTTEIRQIVAEIDVLPNVVHGSALFTRGETQALVVTTLGTGLDEQLIDDIEQVGKQRFLLHYNFPPYSVGEVGGMRGTGRREIGHGKLALRAINPLLPSKEEFPYTIRVVSEITESNGSSSMATVCGASLSLMAAGVPLPKPIAGIAMGLILEQDKYQVLSDINGDEDHLGDMDFKVAGTASGVTALQMDIKVPGVTKEIMQVALAQAKDGRLHILQEMQQAISVNRTELAESAPRIVSLKINKEKIGELIGPGGKVIKEITEKSGAKIDILEDGTVNIASNNGAALQAAIDMVNAIFMKPEIGQIYQGKVSRVLEFGAVVALSRSVDGMVHISELAAERVGKVSDVVQEGDVVQVKVIDIEKNGRIKFTMKGLNNIVAKETVIADVPLEQPVEKNERPKKPAKKNEPAVSTEKPGKMKFKQVAEAGKKRFFS